MRETRLFTTRSTTIGFAIATALLGPVLSAGCGDEGDESITTVRGAVTGTAVINGIRGAGEWDSAQMFPVFSGGAFAGSTFFVMNDDVNLYLALQLVGDADLTTADIMNPRFDNTNDNVTTNGDDEAFLTTTGFADSHFETPPGFWGLTDALQSGAGVVGRAGAVSFFEMSKPLRSGDPQDFNLNVGNTVGICLTAFVNGASGTFTTFPTDCNVAGASQAGYLDYLVTASSANQAILGMDNAALWTGAGVVGNNARHTEGTASLVVRSLGFTLIESAALRTLGLAPARLSLDLLLPPNQPNPFWFGQVLLYIDVPSRGVYNAYIGEVALAGRPLDQFFTITYQFPTAITQALAGTYTDLRVRIALNVPQSNLQYLLDNVRFLQ